MPEANITVASMIKEELENPGEGVELLGISQGMLDGILGKNEDFALVGDDGERAHVHLERFVKLSFLRSAWVELIKPTYINSSDTGAPKTKIAEDAVKVIMSNLLGTTALVDARQKKAFQDAFVEWHKTQESKIMEHRWDSEKPLLVYSGSENEFTWGLLRSDIGAFIQKANPENREIIANFVSSVFDKSLSYMEEINKNIERAKLKPPVYENVRRFAGKSALTETEKDHLTFFMVTPRSLLQSFDKLFQNSKDIESMYERAFLAPRGSLGRVLSYLKDTSMLEDPSHHRHRHLFRAELNEGISSSFEEKYIEEKDFWLSFSNNSLNVTTPSGTLKERDFSFLGRDLANMSAVLSSENPKILLIAKNGYGSSSLMDFLAQKEDFVLSKQAEGFRHSKSVNMQRQSARHVGKTILLFDKSVTSSSAEWNKAAAEKNLTPEVWVVSDAKFLNEEALSSFDFIIDMPAMPFKLREELAKQSFEKTVAERVAKTCPTPKLISKVAEWSARTGQTSWNDLSSVIGSMTAAAHNSVSSNDDIPVTLIQSNPSDLGFDGVVGCPHVVAQAKRVITGLKDPEKFDRLGAKAPKGVLLTGDPGTGKTHLVRAMAQEAGVPLLLASSSAMAKDPSKITAVFAEAKKQAPCILFLDELDAVGSKGTKPNGEAQSPERQAILNRLLTEIDGFEGLKDVMVIGATHREHHLDEALTRSGRLGWRIHFDLPEKDARIDLFQFYLPKAEANWDRIGRASSGLSPADICEVAKRATLLAAFEDADKITGSYITKAIDEILWGDVVDKKVQEAEIYRTAVHEAGHALFAWDQKLDIDRISVRPTKHTLGFVRHFKDEEKIGMTKEDAENRICMLFAGLVAEEIVLKERSFGASSDLQKVRNLVMGMVQNEGMSEDLPGGVTSFPPPSPETMNTSDQAQQKIIRDLKERTTHIVKSNAKLLDALAQRLVMDREMSGEELGQFMKENKHMVFLKETTGELPFISPRKRQDDIVKQSDLFEAAQSPKPRKMKG